MAVAAKKIKSAQARNILGQIMDEVYYRGGDYILEKGRKEMAVIISIEEYKRMKKERLDDFRIFHEIWENNKDLAVNQAEKDISGAIREVRSKTKR